LGYERSRRSQTGAKVETKASSRMAGRVEGEGARVKAHQARVIQKTLVQTANGHRVQWSFQGVEDRWRAS
jgi:hypothetical protein